MGQKIRAKTHTDTEALQNNHSLCASAKKTKTKTVNVTLVYLFSNHLGLLVNLLPIGNITEEVMALCS